MHRNFSQTTIALSLCLAALPGCRNARGALDSGNLKTPVRGGIVKMVAGSDVDHLATTSAYNGTTQGLLRTFTRQLVSYLASSDWPASNEIRPDLAETVPTTENGGITDSGRTYTFHLRRAVYWDTSPPRELNAHDVVRGIKMLCNPVVPTGAPGYYESTILGLHDYCEAFGKVPGAVEDIRRFIETHEIPGVKATDDFTVVFRLVHPTPDFLSLLAMPFASPVPQEYLQYLPDSAEFRQHTISNGPYRITRYVPNREYRIERNPAWNPATDPLRPAHVDGFEIAIGMDAQLAQLQLEAGTADLSIDHLPLVAELATLLELRDPNLMLIPRGDEFALMVYLSINVVGSNNNGALQDPRVREAIAWATDKAAVVQDWGGPELASPSGQAVMPGVAGYRKGADLFLTRDNRGDPNRSRELLAQAGHQRLHLKLAYPAISTFPLGAQTLQSSLQRAGIDVELTPYTYGDFYSRVMPNADNARHGVWDIALANWAPDWYGANNGRSVIEPLFDGRYFGRNSQDYGGYNNARVNALIDGATTADSVAEAEEFWAQATHQITKDIAIVPLLSRKMPRYHSLRTNNCVPYTLSLHCDPTSVWLRQ